MQLESLSWFPGHMTKTRRMIASELGNVDAVCEILDARIPMSSRNPDVDELTAGKPRIVILNRVDQADPDMTKRWTAYFRSLGYAVIGTDARQGGGVKQFPAAVRTLLREKLAAYEAKGQVGRVLRVMVLGIPNVGKSTFINKVSGRRRGFLISGGEVDIERMSRILLDEFRGGKLGRFTLETPPEETA